MEIDDQIKTKINLYRMDSSDRRPTRISKKRKFVADGVFYAELHEFFQTSLKSAGYAGIEVKVTPA